MDEAKAFLDTEIGDLSTLDRADQEAEMQWFIDAAKPFAGMEIKVVSETITTHEYESKVLAPAFTDDHRHQDHARPDRRRRRRREAADADAVGREHLRRLCQRLAT